MERNLDRWTKQYNNDYSTFVRIYILWQIDNISGYLSQSKVNIQNFERYLWRTIKILNDI